MAALQWRRYSMGGGQKGRPAVRGRPLDPTNLKDNIGFMRRTLLYLGILFMGLSAAAQTDADPAVWSHEVHKISDTEFDLVFKGKIMEGWHVYSQFTAEGGSLPSE